MKCLIIAAGKGSLLRFLLVSTGQIANTISVFKLLIVFKGSLVIWRIRLQRYDIRCVSDVAKAKVSQFFGLEESRYYPMTHQLRWIPSLVQP